MGGDLVLRRPLSLEKGPCLPRSPALSSNSTYVCRCLTVFWISTRNQSPTLPHCNCHFSMSSVSSNIELQEPRTATIRVTSEKAKAMAVWAPANISHSKYITSMHLVGDSKLYTVFFIVFSSAAPSWRWPESQNQLALYFWYLLMGWRAKYNQSTLLPTCIYYYLYIGYLVPAGSFCYSADG